MKLKINADLKNEYFAETGKNVYPPNNDPNNVTYNKHFVNWLLDKANDNNTKTEREVLIAYEDWINDYPKKEDQIKQVDKYLKRLDG